MNRRHHSSSLTVTRNMRCTLATLSLIFLLGGFTNVLASDIWVEAGDAGETVATRQIITGDSGPLNQIWGAVGAADGDLYQIEICDFANFSATTVGGAAFDTELFLFLPDGHGVKFNDDSGGTLQSTLTSLFLTANGTYLLAISSTNFGEFDHDPVDAGGLQLWNDEPFDVERAPDGPGAAHALDHWIGRAVTGSYRITMTGVCWPNTRCTGDLDDDGDVSLSDLTILLAHFGTPSGATYADGDLDDDGDVDLNDLAILLAHFGTTCP